VDLDVPLPACERAADVSNPLVNRGSIRA
jgi:hypothetical protein